VEHTVTPPQSLGILRQPSEDARSGIPFERQPIVQLRDGSGGSLSIPGIQVRAEIEAGGGTVSGNDSTTDGTGQAAFTELAINGTGRHRLTFTADGFTSVTSDRIDVGSNSDDDD
jgi:hypothetical protein